jgi:hypothetical protein
LASGTQGIKTLIVLSYQLVSTHIDKYHRWQNLKVYQVLNTLEVLFWFVVVIVTLMGISQYCKNTYCGLSWLIALIATTLTYVLFGIPRKLFSFSLGPISRPQFIDNV